LTCIILSASHSAAQSQMKHEALLTYWTFDWSLRHVALLGKSHGTITRLCLRSHSLNTGFNWSTCMISRNIQMREHDLSSRTVEMNNKVDNCFYKNEAQCFRVISSSVFDFSDSIIRFLKFSNCGIIRLWLIVIVMCTWEYSLKVEILLRYLIVLFSHNVYTLTYLE
jgi:hypothetical protein